ncbi:MAG: hypothetical protein KGH79_00415 [Patescibacteria group bacterium]|nr:hypothetical protein [Patescibacteria group bacterium]
MNTKALIGAVAIIIIAGGVYYFVAKNNSAPVAAPAADFTGQNGAAMSLQSLVAAGAPVACTFSTTTESGSESGTVYVANGAVAGDFTEKGAQGTIDAHMIVENNTSYVWTSMSTTGFKSTVTQGQASTQSNGVNYSSPMNYSCQPWTPDQSKFNLPSNISFTATASYTPPAQGAGATGAAGGSASAGVKGTAAQCAQCNTLPSAQKAQCLAALQC